MFPRASTFDSITALRQAAAPLFAHPDSFGSVIPGLLAGLAAKNQLPAWHSAVMHADHMLALAIWTHPGRPIVATSITAHDESVSPLIAAAASAATHPFHGIIARSSLADSTAHHYARLKPTTLCVYRRLALYRCDRVTIPDAATHLRLATSADLDLATIFAAGFITEVNEAGEEPAAVANRLTTDQRLWLLCDGDTPGSAGLPVSTAAALGDLAPGSAATRIGFVYTPPTHRRSGHAARATAILTHHLLQSRPVVTLYADLANPTSNRIYQSIGFTNVTDCTHWQFGS